MAAMTCAPYTLPDMLIFSERLLLSLAAAQMPRQL